MSSNEKGVEFGIDDAKDDGKIAIASDAVANKSTESMNASDKSDGHDTSGASVEKVDKKPAKRKKSKSKSSTPSQSHKKVKKDPNKPEYPKVGYVRYMNERREELRKEFPDMHHLEVTKKIGEEWMTLSDDKKQPFLDAAIQDKIRYKLEMKAYNKTLKKCEEPEIATPKKLKKKSSKAAKEPKDVNTSDSTFDDSPKKKKKKKPSAAIDENKPITMEAKPVTKKLPETEAKKPVQPELQPISTPPPTPPQVEGNDISIFGDIPIFTEKFLDHNRQMETELKKIRKLNTDYEQQNAVLEKHVENIRAGIGKTNDEVTELRNENDKLEAYLNTMRHKLANQLRNLSIPSEPNGANMENIDKYMNDLYIMAKSNSHGPASLNKAKDLLRKVDLNIDLKAIHQNK